MTLHLIKLCVWVETLGELRARQAERLAQMRKTDCTAARSHRTFQTPRRRDELLDGGSLYWVIKGFVLARQCILDLKDDTKDDGSACCAIVLDPEVVPTRAQARRAFQGWRYFPADDVPRDAARGERAGRDMPPRMREELRTLCLIDY